MDKQEYYHKRCYLENRVVREPCKRRSACIIISHSLQMRVLLENTTFSLHKSIRIAGIIRGRVLYVEIRYLVSLKSIKIYINYFNGMKCTHL